VIFAFGGFGLDLDLDQGFYGYGQDWMGSQYGKKCDREGYQLVFRCPERALRHLRGL
jgi:hypothetical protein